MARVIKSTHSTKHYTPQKFSGGGEVGGFVGRAKALGADLKFLATDIANPKGIPSKRTPASGVPAVKPASAVPPTSTLSDRPDNTGKNRNTPPGYNPDPNMMRRVR